jgi:hypothetical protein
MNDTLQQWRSYGDTSSAIAQPRKGLRAIWRNVIVPVLLSALPALGAYLFTVINDEDDGAVRPKPSEGANHLFF